MARCKDRAPHTGKRCKKKRHHPGPNHQNGDFIWPMFMPELRLPEPPAWAGVEFGDDRFRRVGTEDGRPPIFYPAPDPFPESAEAAFDRSREAAELELRGWWFDLAEKEIEGTVPKAIEYSSTDLVDIGKTLAFCMGREVGDEEAAELGIFFYMQGKMSRWAGAIKTGKRVSDDTLFDIGVYVRMTQRVRVAGGWPGVTLEGSE